MTSKKISIEGSIGAGKSTLIGKIKERGIIILDEPVDKWREYKIGDDNILSLFYKDPHRWAYTFQTIVFKSRIMNRPSDKIGGNDARSDLIISERCPLTDNHIFAKACHANGFMSDMEFDLYNEWSNFMINSFNVTPDKIIYIQSTPEVCLQRINKRNRPEESTISLEYLTQIHNLHEEWLKTTDIPILFIDNDNWESQIEKIIEFSNS